MNYSTTTFRVLALALVMSAVLCVFAGVAVSNALADGNNDHSQGQSQSQSHDSDHGDNNHGSNTSKGNVHVNNNDNDHTNVHVNVHDNDHDKDGHYDNDHQVCTVDDKDHTNVHENVHVNIHDNDHTVIINHDHDNDHDDDHDGHPHPTPTPVPTPVPVPAPTPAPVVSSNSSSSANSTTTVINNNYITVSQPAPTVTYQLPSYTNSQSSHPAPTCSLNATPNNVTAGSFVTLSWRTTNAVSGNISGYGSVALNGTAVVRPNQTTTYTATFMGQDGQFGSCSVTVTIPSTVAVAPVTTGGPTLADVPPTGTPYVTLSEVPYTGLDLGPVGTTLYWAVLAAWCALVAYLIVVKRVQNVLASKLAVVLFGDTEETTDETVETEAPAAPETTPIAKPQDAMDSFITAQIFSIA
jgi:hypothetical protein